MHQFHIRGSSAFGSFSSRLGDTLSQPAPVSKHFATILAVPRPIASANAPAYRSPRPSVVMSPLKTKVVVPPEGEVSMATPCLLRPRVAQLLLSLTVTSQRTAGEIGRQARSRRQWASARQEWWRSVWKRALAEKEYLRVGKRKSRMRLIP